MSHDWIDNELKTVNFNDQRLNHRFSKILKSLSAHPNVSIPAVRLQVCFASENFDIFVRLGNFFPHKGTSPT